MRTGGDREPFGPVVVARDDLVTRRAAAVLVTKAYLSAPQARLVIVVTLGRSPGAWWADGTGLVGLVAGFLGITDFGKPSHGPVNCAYGAVDDFKFKD